MRIAEQPDQRASARSEYDLLAPAYDVLTADYDHVRWLAEIERLAFQHGLRGRRALDVACGTGKSFEPLLAKGYDVVACDISPAMVERAIDRAAGRAEVHVADMRDLPSLGEFDLLTCLDDALNYLLEEQELARAFAGMARNLRAGGVAVFDISLLSTYRSFFATDCVTVADGWLIAWRGMTPHDMPPGGRAEAVIELFAEQQDGWRRVTSSHVQRHYPVGVVSRLLCDAGFQVLACYGQRPGVQLTGSLDERRDAKALFIARRL